MDNAGLLEQKAVDYLKLILAAERIAAIDLVMRAADEFPLEDVYIHLLQESQREVGRLWETGEISIAQEHYATAVTQLVMSMLFPRVSETPKHGRTFLGTTVEGELHEVGIRMVCDVFELRGWKSIYLGSASPASTILDTARDRNPDVIGISIARDVHLTAVSDLIHQIRANLSPRIPILVGGYPFSVQSERWREASADGCALDAVGAVALAGKLCETGNST